MTDLIKIDRSKDIQQIVDNNLCTSCGVCQAICPVDAISFGWNHDSKKPKIDYNKCIHCTLCYRVCPGKELISQFEEEEFVQKNLGKLDTCFLIQKNKTNYNKYIASAGFVTSFLKYLFDMGKIDGALVVSLEGHDLKNAKSHIIKNAEELDNVAGSVYCQVPLVEALEELSSLDGRYAVVGLPCQIRGIVNLMKSSGHFRKKIVMKIGLFCGYMVSYIGMNHLFESLKIPKDTKIKKISFRAKKGKQDGFLVETEGKDYFISRSKYTGLLNRTFSNKRCLMCNDMASEIADISCGDAHGFESKQSLVLSRNVESTKLIHDAIDKGYISLNKKLTNIEAYKSQELILRYKKGTILARLRLMKIFNKHVPEYDSKLLPKSNLSQKTGSLLYLTNCYLTDKKLTRKIFFIFPNIFIAYYGHALAYLLSGHPFDIFKQIWKKIKNGNKN